MLTVLVLASPAVAQESAGLAAVVANAVVLDPPDLGAGVRLGGFSGLVTLPLIILSYAQSSGALFGVSNSGWVLGAVAWLLAILGLWRGTAAMTRERLLGVDIG